MFIASLIEGSFLQFHPYRSVGVDLASFLLIVTAVDIHVALLLLIATRVLNGQRARVSCM
jgi:hypothetical protein